jgi:hypothetical protein
VGGSGRKLKQTACPNEELRVYNRCYSRGMSWVGLAARIGEEINAYSLLDEALRKGRTLKDAGENWRIILK